MKKSVLKALIKEEFQQLMEATDWVKHYELGDVNLGKEVRSMDDRIEAYWKKKHDAQLKTLQADVERFAKTFANKKLNGSNDNAVVKNVRVTWDADGDPNIEFKLETTPINEK